MDAQSMEPSHSSSSPSPSLSSLSSNHSPRTSQLPRPIWLPYQFCQPSLSLGKMGGLKMSDVTERFIYAFMGVGILLCCITFLGCIAAELINGCCLCFYTLLIMVLVIVEAALVAFIVVDHHWEEDLPVDPTGQLDSLRSFIEDNLDICKWVGVAVLVVQALSLLVALILRATISTRREDFDYEDEYDVRGRSWEPLLNPQSGQPSGSTKVDNRGNHSDIWSSRMREKYGLNNGDKYSSQA